MSKQHKQIDAHNQATNEFIALANQLVNDRGFERNLVSAALMAASGVYATFIAAGNQGFLAENGVDKVASIYKNNLAYIQKRKKDRKSTRLNSSHVATSYAVFCLKKKTT